MTPRSFTKTLLMYSGILVLGIYCFGFGWMSRSDIPSDEVMTAKRIEKEAFQVQVMENPLTNINTNRLCTQNHYAKSLSSPLSEVGKLMDNYLEPKTILKKENLLVNKSLAENNAFRWDHTRFDAFEVMGECRDITCLGGGCGSDESKATCGFNQHLANMDQRNKGNATLTEIPPCIVYSIGSNNQWEFELDVLKHSPCHVHSFDCTGDISRFHPPKNDRLFFHHVCLGTEYQKASGPSQGEFWTLDQMARNLKHDRIDLFKMDIEGYEWPLFNSWPVLTDLRTYFPSNFDENKSKFHEGETLIKQAPMALPMQILVEVHYRTYMRDITERRTVDFKFATDMIRFQEHLLKMGYAVVARDDNKACKHCTELTLVRIKCPASDEDADADADAG